MITRDEAVKKLVTGGRLSVAHAEDFYDSIIPKPVVPQFVADWYEEHKDNLNESIWEHLVNWDYANWDDFHRWMSLETGAITTLVNMHQFGYEVEKEMKYEVKLKKTPQILIYDEKNEQYYFSIHSTHSTIFSREYHTRKELEEAGFGWVFDCEGVEVKEVE